MVRLKIFVVVWFVVVECSYLAAATYTAADCSYTAFRNAIASASDGDTIQGPAAGGSATWPASRINTYKTLVIDGRGCNITLTGVGAIYMEATNPNYHPRIANFNFSGSSNDQAVIWVEGNNPNYRVDHNTFTNIKWGSGARSITVDYNTNEKYATQTYGVIDHNTFTYNGDFSVVDLYGKNDNWFSDPNYGTANAMYFEDNTFTWNTSTFGGGTHDAVDCEHGGRLVIRYNHITNGGVGLHDTGSTEMSRSCRMFERYDNDFHCTVKDGSCFGTGGYRGGTGMDFDNSVPISASGSGGFVEVGGTEIKRLTCESTNQCGAPMDFGVGSTHPHAVCSSFRGFCNAGNQACNGNSDCTNGGTQCICAPGNPCTAPPNNAACGSFNGVNYVSIANIDGLGSPVLYPARDQTGVSKDDPTTHAQTAGADPAYSWNITNPNNGNAVILGSTMVHHSGTDMNGGNYILPDRDYYQQVTNFNGSSGVGRGTLTGAQLNSSQPCSQLKVAYWSTTDGKLYQCTATGTPGTWTAYYMPYMYPHPLTQSGGGGGAALEAPTGLTAVAH